MSTAVKALLIVVLVFVGGGILIGGCVYSGYNRAIELEENVKAKWAQVDNQLQRRFDLIPNLVEAVKGIVGHEKDVFLGIAEARKSYFQANSVGDKIKAAGGFESALSRLLVLRETYPELRSNTSFLNLQAQLEGSENRVSVARKRYNEAVQTVNTLCRKVPGRFYCGLAGVEKAEFFKIEEVARQAPKVDFSGKPDDG